MRLIDANKLTKKKQYQFQIQGGAFPKGGFFIRVEDVFRAPTIDAVEVVRCKDCKEYIPWGDGRICGLIGSYFGNTKPNDFCSRGAKMD